MSLIFAWALLLSTVILVYILLDGFDLGIGMLFPWFKKAKDRDIMMSTIAPVWDGNETWLIFGAASLYGAFPKACGLLMPVLYTPIMIMVAALILRGVAFEFHFKGKEHQTVWDVAFAMGSGIATLMQGMILGRFVEGYGDASLQVAAMHAWVTPFSVLTGVSLMIAYSLLGATWLIMRTEGELQEKVFDTAWYLLIATSAALLSVSAGTLFLDPRITLRWFMYRSILWVIPVFAISLVVAAFRALKSRQEIVPFFASVGLFVASYLGFATSLFPYVIPYSLTVWEAAAPPSSLKFSLVGSAIVLPILLLYTSYTYYVFRGKITESIH